MKSIRSTLLLWLSIGLSLGIAVVAILLYQQAQAEANQLFDYQMKQVAAALPSQFFAAVAPGHADELASQENVIIQVWDTTGVRLYYSHDYADLPQRAVLGFTNIKAQGKLWRVYSVQQQNTVVQIAQPISARTAVAARSALNTVAPMLLLIPFLAAFIWITVSRGLLPIRRVAAEVQSRDAAALAAVSSAGLPQEILPLTNALNDLLARLAAAIAVQKTFVADAAHELRTPLTALSLQLQLAERANTDAERNAAFNDLRLGLERATRLVQQLLTLARQEPTSLQQGSQVADLQQLARDAVATFALSAEHRHIDLGIVKSERALVNGDADALAVLFNNLLDNAIRYSPASGRIDVSIEADDETATVIVQDSGNGIRDTELARVFDRFYRGSDAQASGSGLGLAIVKRIADMHHAKVELTNTHPGLRVTVTFPAPVNSGLP